MRRLMLLVGAVVVAVALVAAASGSAGSVKPRWAITDLGTLGGGLSAAAAVNDRGQVVGTSRGASGERRVFLWQKWKMTDIAPYGWGLGLDMLVNALGQVVWNKQPRGAPDESSGVLWQKGVTLNLGLLVADMNDRGQVVGKMSTGHGHRAALWEDGRLRDLGTLPGDGWSEAVAINESGVVVGTSYSDLRWHAFVWRNGTMRKLGVLPGFNPRSTDCMAVAVNNRGQVLGFCSPDSRPLRVHTFLWDDGGMRDLGGGDWVYPVALNDRGQVMLRHGDEPSYAHTALWEDGKLRDLGTWDALKINNKGQIIGWGAWVWENGKMHRLATLGGRSRPWAINDKGQIVGQSATKTGQTHAVLWTLRSG